MSLSSEIKRRAGLDWARVFARLGSTNEYARERELPDGDGLVLALTQTAGRGRGSNRWWSTEGSLTATFVFRAVDGMSPQEVPLRAGLAAMETAARFLTLDRRDHLRLKWPNDVLALDRGHAKKLAGLLCERVRERDIIGVGLNVANDFSAAPEDVKRRAISIKELGAAPPKLADVVVALAVAIRAERETHDWHTRFTAAHFLNQRAITVTDADGAVHGVCEGIEPDGRLILRVNHERRLLTTGTVSF